MSYELRGASAPKIPVFKYPGSKLWCRKGNVAPEGADLVFLGGDETFGRFVDCPFPNLIQKTLQVSCANLGVAHAGVDALLNDDVLVDYSRKARLRIVQVPNAVNLGNLYYRVHPRRNDRFLEPTPALTVLYPELDYTDYHFNRHLLRHLFAVSPDRFEGAKSALKRAWTARMKSLIERLGAGPLVLLLLYHTSGQCDPVLEAHPIWVTQEMVKRVAPQGIKIATVTVRSAAATGEIDAMNCRSVDRPIAELCLGPSAHKQIADMLVPMVNNLLPK